MSNVAIITARGGSKRIPRKNIRLFRGKPIIAYSIETVIKSGLFDMVMVSTDDEEIANVSIKYGAEVPFFRSSGNSGDHASTADVILEVLEKLDTTGNNFEFACCIYPTAPFITTYTLLSGLKLLKDNGYSTVFAACAFSYPVYRGLLMKENNKTEMIWPENQEKRSQDLPTVYHDAGQFYWINTANFKEGKKLFTPHSGAIILNELQVQDIDSESDWKVAELKHALLFPHEK